MPDLDATTMAVVASPTPGQPSVVRSLAAGVFGGALLGVAARGWMRLISEDPEFTWSGSVFIVIGFTIFGTTQAIAAAGRRRNPSRGRQSILRTVGGVGMLPLFVAAGAVMAPTVLGGSFAMGQVQRRSWVRAIGALLALLPVVFVGTDLVDSFGWSAQTAAGMLGLVLIYGTIIRTAQATFAAPPERSTAPRWVRWAMAGGVAVLALAAMGAGGIQ